MQHPGTFAEWLVLQGLASGWWGKQGCDSRWVLVLVLVSSFQVLWGMLALLDLPSLLVATPLLWGCQEGGRCRLGYSSSLLRG